MEKNGQHKTSLNKCKQYSDTMKTSLSFACANMKCSPEGYSQGLFS